MEPATPPTPISGLKKLKSMKKFYAKCKAIEKSIPNYDLASLGIDFT